MDRKSLFGVSILAVILLILGSLTNVVGYQTVQPSNQKTIKNEVNQKELLFQAIVDIANNKEIQRIILKSQLIGGGPPISNIPVLTKNQLRQMYLVGLMLSKIISKSRIHSMVQQFQLLHPEMQQEVSAVIEKDTTLNAEITQLQNSECDCENEKIIRLDLLTTICTILLVLLLPFALISLIFASLAILFQQNPILINIITFFSIPAGFIMLIISLIGLFLNCWGNLL
jgi:hypothetical protein